jgi:pyruvate/2-oxoglutarate dehydrogenase complex dihydrolipoamide dehydrogenase (E3) component
MGERFDLIVVGAGSAGYAAARVAGGLGARVGLVDRGPLGGLCILRGCMPSKTLLASAEVLHRAQQAAELGLVIPSARADLPAIMARKRRLVREFADYRVEQLHNAPNTTLLAGSARFHDAHTIAVAGETYQADTFILATGSDISIPEVPGLADAGYLTSDEALELDAPPESLIVLGGGVIGCELGQFYSRIGVPTTLLQRGRGLLSKEDNEVGETLAMAMEAEGMQVVPNVTLIRVARDGPRKVVHAEVAGEIREFPAAEILVATGRHPAVTDLNLAAAGVAHTHREVPVDDRLRTNVPHIFAAGDVVGRNYIVHFAIQQAEVAAYNAVSGNPPRSVDKRLIPHVVFTDPQYGRVGLTEKEARAAGRDVLIGTYPFADHGKAMCLGRTAGFVKMVADRVTGEILGVAVLGPEGGELLHEMVVAMHFRATAAEFLKIPHVHPTLAEVLTYPAEDIEDQRQALLQPA